MRRLEHEGQTLVEFALVLSVFMLLVVGLFDGLRLAFYYSEVQEAARAGARWGAVEVTRDGPSMWGDFITPGNNPLMGPYTANMTPTVSTGAVTPTIVGAVARKMAAADIRQATVSIS